MLVNRTVLTISESTSIPDRVKQAMDTKVIGHMRFCIPWELFQTLALFNESLYNVVQVHSTKYSFTDQLAVQEVLINVI